MSTSWPPTLQAAREVLEAALSGGDDAEILKAKKEMMEALAGSIYPPEVIAELIPYLQSHGFQVHTR